MALREHRTRQLQKRLASGTLWEGAQWGNLVFATEAGAPLSGFSVTRRFGKLLTAAGLRRLGYHDLRHGAASLMAAQGVTPRVAMEILGHASISTTMEIYTHIVEDSTRDALDRTADAVWGPS